MPLGERLRGRVRQGLYNPLALALYAFPFTITTANGATSTYTWQKKICRTSDGTIHVLIRRTGYITHYYSYNDGRSWASQDVWVAEDTCSLDKDINDNLIAVKGDAANLIKFKKATVDKSSSPWTWSWGAEVTVYSGTEGYYPDILSDGNNYYHITFEVSSGLGKWARSIDGGNTWIVTDVAGFGLYYVIGIIKDSKNNLYLVGAHVAGSSITRSVKITYNGGTSWTVGTYYAAYTWAFPGACHCLPDDRLVIAQMASFPLAIYGDLYFNKTTNPSDVSSWESSVCIETDIDAPYPNPSIMVISSSKIRIYYTKNSILYYKESSDGGASFGSAQAVYAIGTNRFPNVSKYTVEGVIDFLWRNGTEDPFTIYHQFEEV